MAKSMILFASIFLATAMAYAGNTYKGKGEVKSVNAKAEKVLVAHGPIKGLMDAMTMEFNVVDPEMLKDVKPGNKINFSLEADKKGNFTITDMEVVDLK